MLTSALTHVRRDGPQPPRGSYGHVASAVRQSTCHPEWRQTFELSLAGGHMSSDGSYNCQDAPFSTLRIELWHSTGPWAPDTFLGEASVPLVHLMDCEPHTTWIGLEDPQRAAKGLPTGVVAGGHVYLELQYTQH